MSPKVGNLQKMTWKIQPLNLMYLSAQKIFWKMTVGISFSNTSEIAANDCVNAYLFPKDKLSGF